MICAMRSKIRDTDDPYPNSALFGRYPSARPPTTRRAFRR
jgi:hypothetical protein